ncbi:hypothetical protein OBK22_06370 [Empedobacter falsenii]
MKKISCFILLSFLIFNYSCEKNIETDKSLFGINSENTEIVISPSTYEKNGIQLLDAHRNDLRNSLPNSIQDILNHYKDLLKKVEKYKIYATSQQDQQNYVHQIQQETFDSLVTKEVLVNLDYTNLLYDLENLNKEYSEKYNIPIDSLHSYFKLSHISLNEEVFLKINELIEEDKARENILAKRERNEKYTDIAVIAISMLPMGGPLSKIPEGSKKVITQIHNGINSSMKNRALKEGAGEIAKLTYTLSKNTGNSKFINLSKKKIINSISNEAKRTSINTSVVSGLKRKAATVSVITVGNSLNHQKPIKNEDLFKVIENKLEGRIGDYSDGILTVHFQEVRDAVKKNQAIVKRYTKSLN